jgi:Mor family transcriptional regulator
MTSAPEGGGNERCISLSWFSRLESEAERNEIIRQKHVEGISYSDLSEEYGISSQRIGQIITSRKKVKEKNP